MCKASFSCSQITINFVVVEDALLNVWLHQTQDSQKDTYDTFIKSNAAQRLRQDTPGDLNENLFDFQHAIVSWAVRRGRAAILPILDLELMQLSWADEVASHTGGMVLLLAPLAVSEQTIEQGATFGIDVRRVPHGGTPDAQACGSPNYERMESIDFTSLRGLVLDESSILKARRRRPGHVSSHRRRAYHID